MDIVRLKNGSEEPYPIVAVITMSLGDMLDQGLPGVLSAYDLVERCKNSKYQMSEDTEKDLIKQSLLQRDGQPHSSIRNIVLSSIQGEGLEMKFVDPIDRTTRTQQPSAEMTGQAEQAIDQQERKLG